MGTAELSCPSLEMLARDFSVAAVVTQPDKPKGRELKLTPSPVKVLAQKLNLPVLQPVKARDENFIARLRELKPDLIVVVAYGQILPQAILDLPPHGCLNVHPSLLPKYRGAAPIQWAIANGDSETGVAIMKMDAGLDTGPVVSQQRTPIFPEDDSATAPRPAGAARRGTAREDDSRFCRRKNPAGAAARRRRQPRAQNQEGRRAH